MPYAAYPPHGMPPGPLTMPGPVRTAQVLSLVLGGLILLASMALIATDHPYSGGLVIGAGLPGLGCAVCAMFFGSSGSGAKVTAIVFGSIAIFFGLSQLGNERPAGLIEVVIGILIVVMLSQRASGAWFRRSGRG
ncbi:hypothetical protein ACZ90_31715 [Streptomyces albus subsp. albus]|nr:hypothetical protein ACZ90_31715 [Streptomyces albus subsp. albus]